MTDANPAAPESGPALTLASWPRRAGAAIIDSVPPAIIWVVAVAAFGETVAEVGDGQANFAANVEGWPAVVVFLLVLAWGAYNWWYRQGTTGQTVGKMLLGIAVHERGTTTPLGVPRSIGRYFARFLDTCPCFLGLLWPLWDRENRTFSDMMLGSRVHRV